LEKKQKAEEKKRAKAGLSAPVISTEEVAVIEKPGIKSAEGSLSGHDSAENKDSVLSIPTKGQS